MHEPEFYNNTPYFALPVPLLDRRGAECRVVIVKATYVLTVDRRIAEKQRPVRLGDEMWGPPEIADIRYPSDACCEKPGTDVIVVSEVQGDGIRSYADVQIRLADRTKTLRVHGGRSWDQTFTGICLADAAPLEVAPLAWSLSYGGFDPSDPDRPLEEPRNPVGRGIARREEDLIGKPAPRIEDPNHPVASPGKHNVPVGCAPIGRHYEPRRGMAGTYDAAWIENRFPARPDDYDERHENCAPPDFVFQQPLRGGEIGAIAGLKPESRLDFCVPAIRIIISATIDGHEEERRPHLDTVIIDGGQEVIECVWRAAFPCPAKMRNRFTRVSVIEKRVI